MTKVETHLLHRPVENLAPFGLVPENARIAATIYYSHYIPCSLLCLHRSIVLDFVKTRGAETYETKGAFPTKFLQNFPFHLISKISLNFMILRHSSHQVFRPSDDPVRIAMDVGTRSNFV